MAKLGKLGAFFLKVGKIAPAILAIYPPLAPILIPLTAAIQEAEAIHGAGSGAEKLEHVKGVAMDAAATLNAAAGHTVVNLADVSATVESAVSTVINAVNAVHPNQ